jgi:hypothetical protein
MKTPHGVFDAALVVVRRRIDTCLSSLFVAGLVVGVTACDNSSRPPSTPSPTPVVTAITIGGTASLEVGFSFHLTATARLSDGSTVDVTARATWTSSNVEVATISQGGVLAALKEGDTEVRATYGNVAARHPITVVRDFANRTTPSGTYEVAGLVHETAPMTDIGISHARIEVVGGPLAGQVSFADSDGHFRLLNTVREGNFYLNFTHPAYEDVRFWVRELPRDARVDVAMVPNPGQATVEIRGHDICTERPRDPVSGGRTITNFSVSRGGVFERLSQGDIPFSIGVDVTVYRLSPAGELAWRGWPAPQVRVEPGYTYYLEAHGDVELCRRDYDFRFKVPR